MGGVMSDVRTTAVPEALRSEPGPLYPVVTPDRRPPDVPPPAPSLVVSPPPQAPYAPAGGAALLPPGTPAPVVSPPPTHPDTNPDPSGDPLVEVEPPTRPRLLGRFKGQRLLVKPDPTLPATLTPEQRLLILDTWQRSGLPGGDFGELVGVSKHTLSIWKKRFEEAGPGGLMDKQRGGPKGSRISEVTKRAILMIKKANPEYGCERISAMLLRGPALPASPGAVARMLKEEGYEFTEEETHEHPDKVRSFERAKPNEMWQTDLFTFVMKRQNRRVHLVAFMDDHSRFIVSYGLHASSSTALVIEALRAGILSYGPPREVLTDNGPQYVTWRGKSKFSRELESKGIRHIVATPRRPQTLGKVERFWGTLWKECLESAVFFDLEDARKRIGLFIDHYNFQRPHASAGGLVPADRFFNAAPEVFKTLKARVAGNALALARHGTPKAPFYLTGNVGGKAMSLHAEGERLILTREGGKRQEVAWGSPEAVALGAGALKDKEGLLPPPVCPAGEVPPGVEEEDEVDPAPGTSPLDEGLRRLEETQEKGGEG